MADEPAGAPGVGPEALEEALEQAYRYLAGRDRTVAETRRHLARRGLNDAVAEACLAELARQRCLDDAGYARRFAEDRRALDGWGAERIRGRLQALGVADELIESEVGRQDAAKELEAAVEVLRRRLRAAPAGERERQRALGLLVRRGYELDLAYDALRRYEREAA